MGGGDSSYDEAYYASQATVTSSDANFTANDNGGTINFKTEGGSVTLNVSCGCDWLAENAASDLFSVTTTSTSITVTAEQNTVEEELTGTVTLMTAEERISFATITITQTAYGAPTISVEPSEYNFPAVGTLTAEIAVEASYDWTAETADSWLTVEQTESGISLTAEENEETTGREAKVTITCTDGVKTATEYVTVAQDGKAYVTLSVESVSFGQSEDSESVTVESNFDWEVEYDTSLGWLNITKESSGIKVTVEENNGDSREVEVTISAGDGAENIAEATLTVSQSGTSSDALIMTYTITADGTSVQLPLYENNDVAVNCTVDWGDGTTETVTTNEPSHTYELAGEYDIVVEGTVPRLNNQNISGSSKHQPITAVKQWGNTGLTSMNRAFYYCTDLETIPEYTGDAFANVTTFTYAFYRCSKFAKIPEGMFDNCPNVTSFSYCFDATSVPEIPKGLFDNCSNVTTFAFTFHDCQAVKKIPAGLFDNCPSVTTFYCTFYNFYEITEIPKGLFDNCPKVTTFESTFQGCHALKEIPKGLFDKNTAVTNFHSTFNHCEIITEIPEGLFDNCTGVTDFGYTFQGCFALESIPDGLFDKSATGCTTFAAVFHTCESLTEIPKGIFDIAPDITSFAWVFYGCTGLTEIDPAIFSNQKKVTNFQSAFTNCSNLTCESPYDTVEIDGVDTKIHLYERNDHTDIYTKVSTTSSCFNGCTGLTDYDDIPSGWK